MFRKAAWMLTVAIGLGSAMLWGNEPKELPDAAKKELKALEGKWSVEKVVHSDRETTPGDDDDKLIFSFKGSTIDFAEFASGVIVELDPTTEFKCLDFKMLKEFGVLKKGTTYESIYKLDGDTLTWAVHVGREKSRPVTLDKPTDAGTLVIVLTRVKE